MVWQYVLLLTAVLKESERQHARVQLSQTKIKTDNCKLFLSIKRASKILFAPLGELTGGWPACGDFRVCTRPKRVIGARGTWRTNRTADRREPNQLGIVLCPFCCANQCDQIWQNFATLAKDSEKFAGSFSIWQHVEPTLVNSFAFGQIIDVVNGHILNKISSHLVTLAPTFSSSFHYSACLHRTLFKLFRAAHAPEPPRTRVQNVDWKTNR